MDRMVRPRFASRPRSRPAVSRRHSWIELPHYQTRTCVRCGRHTLFVLDDAVGDWYVCSTCGAYA
jgi:hypothetical protein